MLYDTKSPDIHEIRDTPKLKKGVLLGLESLCKPHGPSNQLVENEGLILYEDIRYPGDTENELVFKLLRGLVTSHFMSFEQQRILQTKENPEEA